jgi:hypothetical protein
MDSSLVRTSAGRSVVKYTALSARGGLAMVGACALETSKVLQNASDPSDAGGDTELDAVALDGYSDNLGAKIW